MNATHVINALLASSKLFAAMNDGTTYDTLFDNSGTHNFTRWLVRGHVLYFFKLQFLLDLPQGSFWSENHEEFHPLLENLPYLTNFRQSKMCPSDLLLDVALLGCLLISRQ